MNGLLYEYKLLEHLDFDGKGENFVRENFVSPLLKYLGYECHKDYKVLRDGDEDMSFKLRHISVERGARKMKNLNPDYMPTIRKRCFWIIEAKTARDLAYPFADNFIVQGLQYCIHPEIRAKYLVLTNGLHTSVYDSFSRIYGDGDIYEPILEFGYTEISSKWNEIYQLLSAEKVREFIEDDILSIYEKVVTSSLDSEYPRRMLRKVEKISEAAIGEIIAHVSRLRYDSVMQSLQTKQEESSTSSIEDLDFQMDFPLICGKGIGQHLVKRSIELEVDDAQIFDKLTECYEKQSYFRKENTIAALCALLKSASDTIVKDNVIKFLQFIANSELPLINCVECALVRIRRKLLVINVYSELREEIKQELNVMPEMVRHINPPTALSETYPTELMAHWSSYKMVVDKSKQELASLYEQLKQFERTIDVQYNIAQANVDADEREFCGGLEIIGLYYKNAFANIMKNILGEKCKLIDENFNGIGLFLQDD